MVATLDWTADSGGGSCCNPSGALIDSSSECSVLAGDDSQGRLPNEVELCADGEPIADDDVADECCLCLLSMSDCRGSSGYIGGSPPTDGLSRLPVKLLEREDAVEEMILEAVLLIAAPVNTVRLNSRSLPSKSSLRIALFSKLTTGSELDR